MTAGMWAWHGIVVFALVVPPIMRRIFGIRPVGYEEPPDPHHDVRPFNTPKTGEAWEQIAPYPECFEEENDADL